MTERRKTMDETPITRHEYDEYKSRVKEETEQEEPQEDGAV